MQVSRPQYAAQLDLMQVADFSASASFDKAVQGVDGIIHVASPFTYDTKDNEEELVKPAIAGVKAVLEAAAKQSSVKRVVVTSSFAAILDVGRREREEGRFAYTAEDWNPLSYEEAVAKDTTAVVAYRGSKKFAELAAWDFVKERKPAFDIVTLCPPMTFGPIAHPISSLSALNESNAMLWNVASGKEMPVARVPFWVDVRDLAVAHVEALFRPEAGGKRFAVSSPEKFSYGLVKRIVEEEFEWGRERVAKGEQEVEDSFDLDGETAGKELGVKYRSFREMVKDFVTQAVKREESEGR